MRNDIVKIFCLTHRANFPVLLSGSQVACEEGGTKHILSNHFPSEGNWLYCCNCRNFWLVAPDQVEMYVKQCPACGCGENARFYTCDQCNVTMVDFDDCTRHKSYNILSWGMPQPACPGCRSFPRSAPQLHECKALRRKVASARDACVFCADVPAAENGNSASAQRFAEHLAANTGNGMAEPSKPLKEAPQENPTPPVALAVPPGNGNGYKRNGAHGKEHLRERSAPQPGVQPNRGQGAPQKGRPNGKTDDSRQTGKTDEAARALRELEAKRAALEALTKEAEAKLREAEERNRSIEQREAELRRLAEEQERVAAESRRQAEEQARTAVERQAEMRRQVEEQTRAATQPVAELPPPAEVPPSADQELAGLSKAELDRQLEAEWARIEVEIKKAEAERKARNSVGFQRTIVPPNRPVPRLEKIRDKTPTRPFPAAADERDTDESSSRSLASLPRRTSKFERESFKGNRLENSDGIGYASQGATTAQLNQQTAPLEAIPAPAPSESVPLDEIELADIERSLQEIFTIGSQQMLNQTRPTGQLDFGPNQATRHSLLIGYVVVALLLLALLFGLGSFAFYLFNRSS
jgi:hypothetical protein